MSKKLKLKMELAPQEAIRFNQKLIDLFIIEVLGISEFMITDESYVSDMLKPNINRAKQVSPTEWEYEQTFFDTARAKKLTGKDFFELTKAERDQFKNTRKDLYKKDELFCPEETCKKVKEFFGIDLDPKFFDGLFVDLGKELSSKISIGKRDELFKNYAPLW